MDELAGIAGVVLGLAFLWALPYLVVYGLGALNALITGKVTWAQTVEVLKELGWMIAGPVALLAFVVGVAWSVFDFFTWTPMERLGLLVVWAVIVVVGRVRGQQ